MAVTKVLSTSLLNIVSTASNLVTIGSAVDVSLYDGADIMIRMGRATATAFTVGPKFRVEGSYVVSPTANQWRVLYEVQALIGASIGSQAVSGTEAAGQTDVTLAAGTNFAAGNYVFFHNSTLANSEWSRVVSLATATLSLEEAIVNAQTGATARNQAEQYPLMLDLEGIQKMRLVVNNAGSGQAVICAAEFAGFYR